MAQLVRTVRLRISNEDYALFNELKRLKKKPTTFIREAFRHKISVELPELLLKEQEEKDKIILPF